MKENNIWTDPGLLVLDSPTPKSMNRQTLKKNKPVIL